MNPVDQLRSEIDALKRTIAENEAALVRLDALVRELQRDVLDRDGLIAVAEAELMQRRRQVDSLDDELQRRKHAIDTILRTRSWKLTAPLRLAGIAARRIRGMFRGAPSDGLSSFEQVFPSTEAHEDSDAIAHDTLSQSRGVAYVHRVTGRLDASKLQVRAVALYDTGLRTAQDWEGVVRAVPRYRGHYQPHLPGELGRYDAGSAPTVRLQVQLARQYGVFGFCFEIDAPSGGAAWRDGAPGRLLEDATLDIAFCFYCRPSRPPEPSGNWDAVIDAFDDSRYVRLDGRPVVLLDSAGFETRRFHSRECVEELRAKAAARGIRGLYCIAAGAPGDPAALGCDAVLELEPSDSVETLTPDLEVLSENWKGSVHSFRELAERGIGRPDLPFQGFDAVAVGWDDEAIRPDAGTSFAGSTPDVYAEWLETACRRALAKNEGLVFIDSWNGWRHGAHLEPDRRRGYAYLHATATVLRYFYCDSGTRDRIEAANARFRPSAGAAIVFHCHYEDLIAPIFDRYLSRVRNADLIVTVPNDISRGAVDEMIRRFPRIYFLVHENRGRDIRPFLFALRHLQAHGYELACKIHTKKTPNWDRGGGARWRHAVLESLLGADDSVELACRIFSREPRLGLLVPSGSTMDLSVVHVHARNTVRLDELLLRMGRTDLIGSYNALFPAGSMYWFRVAALAGLDELVLDKDEFERELGQSDGTLSHAIERLVAVYAQGRGYLMEELPGPIPPSGPVRTDIRPANPGGNL